MAHRGIDCAKWRKVGLCNLIPDTHEPFRSLSLRGVYDGCCVRWLGKSSPFFTSAVEATKDGGIDGDIRK